MDEGTQSSGPDVQIASKQDQEYQHDLLPLSPASHNNTILVNVKMKYYKHHAITSFSNCDQHKHFVPAYFAIEHNLSQIIKKVIL
jgi:glycine betaine/choline ABC-type transport system substrate-binding protein